MCHLMSKGCSITVPDTHVSHVLSLKQMCICSGKWLLYNCSHVLPTGCSIMVPDTNVPSCHVLSNGCSIAVLDKYMPCSVRSQQNAGNKFTN